MTSGVRQGTILGSGRYAGHWGDDTEATGFNMSATPLSIWKRKKFWIPAVACLALALIISITGTTVGVQQRKKSAAASDTAGAPQLSS